MNKIDTSFAVDPIRQPFTADSLDFLQFANLEAIKNLAEGVVGYVAGQFVILWGCQIAGSDPGVRSLTAGAVLYNGEVYSVAGTNFTTTGSNIPVWILDVQYASFDPVTFDDSSTHSVHQIRKMKLVEGPIGGSGVANYVCDYNATVVRNINPAWKYVGASGNPAFANNWANAGTVSGSSDLYESLRFKKSTNNIVSIEGSVKGSTLSFSGFEIFTLPSGYRPSKVHTFTSHYYIVGTGFYVGRIQIDTFGHVIPFLITNSGSTPVAVDLFSLDGISFSID
jgi:hypothetical protein